MRQLVFDRRLSQKLKEVGMAYAANHRYDDLHVAQQFARRQGKRLGQVTADDVCYAMAQAGIYDVYQRLGNARGSIFKEDCWRWTGYFKPSERTYAHANPLRVWEYIGDQ